MAATSIPSPDLSQSLSSLENNPNANRTPELRDYDSFLMLDGFSVDKNDCFPDHPHRGFETVTYMLEGQFQHEDFARHKGTIGPWGFAHKMCEPQYQELLDEQISRAKLQDGVVIKVIAGESHGVKFQIYTRTPTILLNFKMYKDQTVSQTIPTTYTGFIYVLSGTAYIGDPNSETEAKFYHTILLSEDSTSTVRIQTKDEAGHFVLIAGESLKEPVVQVGSFVMNTREEV
ncbi:RmlC-like cupin [Linnemannia elongata AG-77]|uniref:RmlC-like cupin n=1 Tax=Linnemannia elongata AG-77 TaxID=1314771 RepID=A0A197JJW5_9FUNG|nr:RmlC-like cupin [Linnemannia elongata AG-77]